MTDQHPIITPPPLELVQQWIKEFSQPNESRWQEYEQDIATCAAQWGADQELEACCEWANETGWQGAGDELRAARRPKPKSLKEKALQELDKVDMLWATEEFGKETLNSLDTIRKALEALPDD